MSSCAEKSVPKDMNLEKLIPIPVSMEATGLSFAIDNNTKVISDDKFLSTYTADMINAISGTSINTSADVNDKNRNINLVISDNSKLGKEDYMLDINPERIVIEGKSEHGIFNGIQTLRQMIPLEKTTGPILIASGKIQDAPRFGYRGAMLDVARHFFQVKDVKRYIDLLAMYKINTLHLHLTDDQGWRIEIKSWPKLTTVGGATQVGGGKGGYYTQAQYKDIVKYAQDRFITIIPEIDMPGHTNAALVAYPELNCNKKDPSPKLYTGMEVGFSTFCTDRDIVYKFVDDVVREISAMTPGKYFHIGGDESHVTAKKDYIPFIEKVEKIVENHGKKVMGWDEIAHAKLAKDAIVHYWNNDKNAILGIAQNAKVLMSPAHKTYLDMQYDSTTHLGLHWAAYIEVDSAYIWDPADLSPSIKEENIVGVESPLWSETVTNMDEIEYMAFPRIIGHAEIGWSPQSKRNWAGYKTRLIHHGKRMKMMDVDFYESKLINWE